VSSYDFGPEILQDFLTESGELLEQLEGDLVDLESTPTDPELLNQIFRALHTIKGSASFLALTNLVAIAHCAESTLNSARNGVLVVGKAEMDLLLAAVDILKVQFDELTDGKTDLSPADPYLIQQLTDLGEGKSLNSNASSSDEKSESSELSSSSTAKVYADGRSSTSITLDSSKLDLIEHLAADIDETISQAISKINELSHEENRSATGCNLTELFEDIARTVDFFEIDGIVTLANALVRSVEGLDSLTTEQIDQMIPRMHGACMLLNEQTKGLIDQQLVSWDTTTIIERLTSLGEGKLLSEGSLKPGCDPSTALQIDGISFIPDSRELREQSNPAASANFEPISETVNSTPSEVKAKATAPQAAQRKAGVNAIEQTIRVEVSRLESLMNLVGELVLQKNRIGAMSEAIGRSSMETEFIEQMELTASTLDRVTGDIQLAVMRTRMQPLDKLFRKYPRLIRDLATKTGKKIQLDIIGGDTEVDKSVIEELGDPLVHLLRNSADHGVETPEVRLNSGKDETGTIKLVAGHEGSHVNVQIIDDGKGLSREVIGNKAVERGLVSNEQLAALSDEEVFRYILKPGFSTAEQVSDLSGRGVGMDVVRTNIESKLKGSISIESREGVGTMISISIPLTIAIMPTMMVAVSDEVFAIPLTNITEIVHPTPEMISKLGDEPVIHLRGSVYPLISSQEIFDVPESKRLEEEFVVVIRFNKKIIGLRVASVIGQQEIVIKPLNGVKREGPISGATVRNDGGVSLIMDIAELMRVSRIQRAAASMAS